MLFTICFSHPEPQDTVTVSPIGDAGWVRIHLARPDQLTLTPGALTPYTLAVLAAALSRLSRDSCALLCGPALNDAGCLCSDLLAFLSCRGIRGAAACTSRLPACLVQGAPYLLCVPPDALAAFFSARCEDAHETLFAMRCLQARGARNLLSPCRGGGALLLTENGLSLRLPPPYGAKKQQVPSERLTRLVLLSQIQSGDWDTSLRAGLAAAHASCPEQAAQMFDSLRWVPT